MLLGLKAGIFALDSEAVVNIWLMEDGDLWVDRYLETAPNL